MGRFGFAICPIRALTTYIRMEAKMYCRLSTLVATLLLTTLGLATFSLAQDELQPKPVNSAAPAAAPAESTPQTDVDVSDLIKRTTGRLNDVQTYDLRYKLTPETVLRWTTEHTESRKTQIARTTEESSSRSRAVNRWEINSADSLGNMTFTYRIESCDMWQQTGEDDPITYNSETDEEAPLLYETFSQGIGTVAATVTINPRGRIVNEQRQVRQVEFGIGSICIAFPDRPIPAGHQWYVPGNLSAKDEHGLLKQLDIRVHYTLTRVKKRKAYISFRTEVLTPVSSPKVRSKIMQKMTRGYAVFDLDRGYIVRREVDWDETVQEFEGVGSYLKYLGKYTERWLPAESESKKNKFATASALEIKPIDGKPIMRR